MKLSKITSFLPFGKKEEVLEYYFALNIGLEKLTAALWAIESSHLKVLATSEESYSSSGDIIPLTDKLLDQVLGLKDIEPQKILFGVPNSWIVDENLKEEHLKLLRNLVKELDLKPMAYVADTQAVIHFLEKTEGIPTTAILAGFEQHHLSVSVVRAGKLDGVKVVQRGGNPGADLEKALLSFTDVETLPSKILIYGEIAEGLKSQLLSFSWMSKLSFLHFPKIDSLAKNVGISSICVAGASEIDDKIKFNENSFPKMTNTATTKKIDEDSDSAEVAADHPTESKEQQQQQDQQQDALKDNFGFVVGDVLQPHDQEDHATTEKVSDEELAVAEPESNFSETDDFMPDVALETPPTQDVIKSKVDIKKYFPKAKKKYLIILGFFGVFLILIAGYLFASKADVKIYVEPKVLEEDAQVTADPNQKTVDENAKIIPGQIVETEVSGNAKDTATGKKQVGESAKGTVKIINNASDAQTFSKGTVITSSGGIKFTLDTSVNIASTSAVSDTKSTATVGVTAVNIGADGNLPSDTQFTISNGSQVAAIAEGNFSGGTSKDVTVVSSDDAQRLLAKLSSDLRSQAQQKLQTQYPGKKVSQEALSESIIKKSYSKNINDQASDFSLNLTIHYKGTVFEDKDLRSIVSRLVNTKVPDGYALDLTQTETQAAVSKLEKGGKLIFLAKFKSKLIPKIDTDKIKGEIRFKTPADVDNIVKSMDNILGSEVTLTPSLPGVLQRLPILTQNIHVEVGLK